MAELVSRKKRGQDKQSPKPPKQQQQQQHEANKETPVTAKDTSGPRNSSNSMSANLIVTALLVVLVALVAVEKHDLHAFISQAFLQFGPNAPMSSGDGEEVALSPEFVAFDSWLRERGANSTSVYFKQYTDQVRGVVTRHFVAPHTLVISIPKRLIITDEMGYTDTELGKCLAPHKETLNSKAGVGLTIYLLHVSDDPSHELQPYMKTLPKDISNVPVWWGPDKLKWLQGSPSLEAVRKRAEGLRQDFEFVNKVCPDLAAHFSYDRYLYYRTLVSSRSYGAQVGDTRMTIMVPHCDMLNHKRPRDTRWKYNRELEQFEIRALNPIEPGNQLTISYGDKSNTKFFTNYGFALEYNRDEELGRNLNDLKMNISLYSSASHDTYSEELIAAKKMYLGEDHLSREFKIMMAPNESDIKLAFRYLRVIAADEKQLKQIVEDQDVVKHVLSRRNEAAALEVLADAMHTQLAGYSNTMAENVAMLTSGSIQRFSDRYVALLVVLSEQELAHHWVRVAQVVVPMLRKYSRESLAKQLRRLPKTTQEERDVYEYGQWLSQELLAE